MSRKTTFAVAALLSLFAASTAVAQGAKTDTTKKKAPATAPKAAKMTKADTGAKKAATTEKAPTAAPKAAKMAKAEPGKKAPAKTTKKGAMTKDSTAKKP